MNTIIKMDLDGNTITTYPTLKAAALDNRVTTQTIQWAIRSRAKSKGFKWRYSTMDEANYKCKTNDSCVFYAEDADGQYCIARNELSCNACKFFKNKNRWSIAPNGYVVKKGNDAEMEPSATTTGRRKNSGMCIDCGKRQKGRTLLCDICKEKRKEGRRRRKINGRETEKSGEVNER